MSKPATIYRAYLLRCWCEATMEAVETGALRFSLEDPHTGEREVFAGFEALVAFLRGELTPARKWPDG